MMNLRNMSLRHEYGPSNFCASIELSNVSVFGNKNLIEYV